MDYSYLWTSVYLDQERDQFQRVLRNVDADEIQQIFSTTQNQILSLQDKDLFGLQGRLDRDQSPWKQTTQRKGVCLRGIRVVLRRTTLSISEITRSFGEKELGVSV